MCVSQDRGVRSLYFGSLPAWWWAAHFTCPLSTYTFSVNTWCQERCFVYRALYTQLLLLCSCVKEPRACKEELVKVVVAGSHSHMPGLQGEMMGSMWPTVQAVETVASSFGLAAMKWIWAPFDGWIFLDPVKLNWSLWWKCIRLGPDIGYFQIHWNLFLWNYVDCFTKLSKQPKWHPESKAKAVDMNQGLNMRSSLHFSPICF